MVVIKSVVLWHQEILIDQQALDVFHIMFITVSVMSTFSAARLLKLQT